MYEDLELSVLLGKTLQQATTNESDEIIFITNDKERYVFNHVQDCCESVFIESIVGDLQDLVGEPLLVAEKTTSSDFPDKPSNRDYEDESYTWTFYKFATKKGYVDIRWYGSSNGYYSESVSFSQQI
jgi:hypothetical protein